MENNKKRAGVSDFDWLMESVKGMHSKRMNALLVTMDDEDFAVNYFKILEYASPKLQRSEIVEEEKEFKVTLEHTFSSELKADTKESND